ncbi:uncharacterized protein LOC114275670 isoform X2 [Camellia sinensis]|uniref:uncharacterized protein LOC114275670 isoform X2 n=1 Tax=Camellia sinensis TaxID=4442 RepID=UPI00103673BC|nr:uncharacterized protein LOC114275670 isoform X2 [Camellia sinensis]
MDHLTKKGSRVAFARICVEIEASSKFPTMYNISCGGDHVVIHVEYQGLPAKCEHYLVFGHDTTKCVKTQVEKLVTLHKVNENEPEPGWSTIKSKGKRKVGENATGLEVELQQLESEGNEETCVAGQSVNNQQLAELAEVSTGEDQISTSNGAEPKDSGGEISIPNLDGLNDMRKELAEIVQIALPKEAEILEKVEKWVESTPDKRSTSITDKPKQAIVTQANPLARVAAASGRRKCFGASAVSLRVECL